MATEQEDITGTPTVSWMDPSGRSLSEGTTGDFTVTRQIVGRTVTLSLQFNPVRASHSGQYSCRVELGTVSFIATERYNLAVVVGMVTLMYAYKRALSHCVCYVNRY